MKLLFPLVLCAGFVSCQPDLDQSPLPDPDDTQTAYCLLTGYTSYSPIFNDLSHAYTYGGGNRLMHYEIGSDDFHHREVFINWTRDGNPGDSLLVGITSHLINDQTARKEIISETAYEQNPATGPEKALPYKAVTRLKVVNAPDDTTTIENFRRLSFFYDNDYRLVFVEGQDTVNWKMSVTYDNNSNVGELRYEVSGGTNPPYTVLVSVDGYDNHINPYTRIWAWSHLLPEGWSQYFYPNMIFALSKNNPLRYTVRLDGIPKGEGSYLYVYNDRNLPGDIQFTRDVGTGASPSVVNYTNHYTCPD